MAPGVSFGKTWRFRNDASTPWPGNCELVAVGSDAISIATPAVVRGDVPPGHEADVTAELIAPSDPGFYQAYFRLREVGGRKFGQRVWVSVTVPASSSSSSGSESEGFVAVDPTPGPGESEPVDTAYSKALAQLAEMGFQDQPANVQLLARYRGNVERVVARLSGDQA